ncbi:MAG TPA: sulfur carrier protein ThiS [Rhodothermales bacterium]|nr:sulfur carrier protein ThiS [Rhodothermales bacterium]
MNDVIGEISITVNGQAYDVADGIGLPELLRQFGVDPEQARGIAVAVNDEVVSRRHWMTYPVGEGDRVEIVTAKQGG